MRRGTAGRARRAVKRLRRERRRRPALLALGRALPDFLVVGTARGGTTSLHAYLSAHPLVVPARRKEVHFFCHHYEQGLSWYRRHFPGPLARGGVRARHRGRLRTGEATPCYLSDPAVPDRVAATLPDVRLIALLRDPVARAYSVYHHFLRRGRETLPFDQVVGRELDLLRSAAASPGAPDRLGPDGRPSILGTGLYAEQLERWLARVPPERLLVVCSEELFAAPAAAYARVLAFLGLPPFEPASFAAPRRKKGREPMGADVRARLVDFYREPNERLYALLGRDLGWSR